MSRQVLNVLVEGLTITAVIVAFLATSARMARPAPVDAVEQGAANRTTAQDLRGLTAPDVRQFFSVGGAESLTPRSDIREFFPTGASRTFFYPGALSPAAEDLFQPDRAATALKLIEVPTR
jgi:hypothetical protein